MRTVNKWIIIICFLAPVYISSAHAGQYLDQMARREGFRNWTHYMSTYNYCLRLLSVNDKYLLNSTCRYDDMNCLMQEAEEMMNATQRLMNSYEWRNSGCDRIA